MPMYSMCVFDQTYVRALS